MTWENGLQFDASGNLMVTAAATSTQASTLYVTTTGNDTNSGLGWGSAMATLQAAINALPANGGVVEVGYGTFTDARGYTIIDSNLVTGPVHIRGRGMGRSISGGNAAAGGQLTEVHGTTLGSTLIVRAPPTRSTNNTYAPEALWTAPVLVEDLAVVVGSGGWNAVGVLACTPLLNFRRVAFDSCGAHGVMSAQLLKFTVAPTGTSGTLNEVWGQNTGANFVLVFSDGEIKTGVTLTNNSAAVSWTGALTGTPTVYVLTYQGVGFLDAIAWFLNFEKCLFVGNTGCGYLGQAQVTGFYDCRIENNIGTGSGNASTPFTGQGTNCSALDFQTIGSSQEVSFYNCVIQRQQAGCAAILYNGTALQLSSCHIENNKNANNGEINVTAGVVVLNGCYFVPGPSTAGFGVWVQSNANLLRPVGCAISGGNNWTFGFTNSAGGNASSGASWGNRYSSAIPGAMDGLYTTAGNVFGGFLAASLNVTAIGRGIFTGNLIVGDWQQVLSAAGAVTFDASTASGQICVLAANASSSSITNPSHGQLLSITWEQDNTGARTYVWPTNCKFAGNAAPAASAAANLADTVTFRCFWTGTNFYWREIARSVGVPAPAV